MDKPLRFLFSTAEAHPTWRADVKTLFGKYLPQLGVQTDLVAIQVGPKLAEPWAGGQLFTRRGDSGLSALMADLLLQLGLFRRAFGGYDGIIVRDKPVLCLIGYLAARLAGIPYIYWISFPLPEAFLLLSRDDAGRISRFRRLHLRLRGALGTLILNRFVLHHADWVFAQSDYMITDLRANGLKHDRISAVPMGVDVEALPAAPATTPAELVDRTIAIYLGSLDRIRKPEILVDTALLVGPKISNFTMLIVGEADEPSDRGWLQEYARSCGAMQWLHFTGRLAQSQAMSLTRLARVGLSPIAPSKLTHVSSPTKPLEYMALGVPVVCNNLPDQASVLAASGAGWCVEFSAQEFADAILECLSDPARAEQMSVSGRAWVQANRSYRSLAEAVAITMRQIHLKGARTGVSA